MVEVRYFSKSGNTKAVAEAIANAAGVDAKDVNTPIAGQTEVLFLGGAVYAFRIAGELKKFIKTLPQGLIGKVVVFSTSGNPRGASGLIKKQLQKCGFTPAEREFHCVGGRARDAETQQQAAQFVREILGKTTNDET